jgi:flagellar biosynthetic protein FliP
MARGRSRNVPAGWWRALAACLLVWSCALSGGAAQAQERPTDLPGKAALPVQGNPTVTGGGGVGNSTPTFGMSQIPDLSKRENLSSALQIIILLTVLSLAPAILIMMTSFTRIVIVMSLLRQALGTQQLPPNQILIGLSLFMTFLVMRPTWERVNADAVQPYLSGAIEQREALDRAQRPVRDFMFNQIAKSDNWEDVYMFAQAAGQKPKTRKDVATLTLIPAFVLSELKTAFLLGFKIYLPFLIIDMVISAVLISMGMMMLPPVLISLPFKLLLFVLVDGWHLITGSLMGSFVT